MKIEQIYTGCLSQGAYYIQSENEVAIIDPLREVVPYIQRAEKDRAAIKYVFETHFHADFVSGHVDLAAKTGAKIIFGPNAQPSFSAHIAHDGEEFKVGRLKIRALHTPGHTLESTCYLLLNEIDKEIALFTGDTLFLGDVGRPDLAQQDAGHTEQQLAGFLFDSLTKKILPLPDNITLYPGHGAGSACGKNMMKETIDTLGHQKETNYALRQPSKEAFIEAVTEGLTPPPAYFPLNVLMNKNGSQSMDDIMEKSLRALAPQEFERLAKSTGALILDTRDAEEFAEGHIPQSINIGLEGQFAPWVGALVVDIQQPLLLIAPSGREQEVVTRLSRVGFDLVQGYLQGGIEGWTKAGKQIDKVERISADDYAKVLAKDAILTLDVRKENEFETGHVHNAENKPLDTINDWMVDFTPDRHFYVHCAGGYRSMIAASILKARGFHRFSEVRGGYKAIAETLKAQS